LSYIIIICTTSNIDNAKNIANHLVSNKLAACVNIIPQIVSIYEWNNQIQQDSECILFIKTHNSLFDKVKEEIIDLHPYELPEIISITIDRGHTEYLDWLKKCILVQ